MKLSLLLIFVVLVAAEARPKDATDELIAVAVLFRHGDRTIIETYPNDPYKDRSNWPVGWGQLTNGGKKRQYELGKWFRARYADFLNETYSEDDIYVRSSDVDRSLMSAEANLAGLYPPKGSMIWNKTLLWQPIPVHVVPRATDNVLRMSKPCPKYEQMARAFSTGTLVSSIIAENQKWFDYCTEKTGTDFTTLTNFQTLHDVLKVEKEQFSFKLPEWTSQVYPTITKNLSGLSFAMPAYNADLARLKIGPLFNFIFTHFEGVLNNRYTYQLRDEYVPPTQKFLMLSAHDTTVAYALQAMKNFDNEQPPYASTVIFELRGDRTAPYLNVLYKKNEELIKVVLEGCDFDCDYQKFIGLMGNVTIDNETWEKECAYVEPNDNSSDGLKLSFSLILGLFLLNFVFFR